VPFSPGAKPKAFTTTVAAEDPALDYVTSPPGRAPKGLYSSQPSLLLDTLEAMQGSSPFSGSEESEEDESEDPEAEAQCDLLEAESMLRYGLAKLTEITEKFGRAVIEEHVRVFDRAGPVDGIVSLNRMLERARTGVGTEAAEAEAAGNEDEAAGSPVEETRVTEPEPDPDATSAALSHVAEEFSQKLDALSSAGEESLAQEEVAVLFSEVLLRNALAFLRRCDSDLVGSVHARLAACGEEPGSTGFDLLNRLLEDTRAHSALHAVRRTRGDFTAGAGEHSPRTALSSPSSPSSPARAAEAQAEVLAEEPLNGEQGNALDPEESVSLLSASDMAANVLTRVMAEYDERLLTLGEHTNVNPVLAQLLLAEELLRPALGFLRNLEPEEMLNFWQLGEQLHALEPEGENGAQLLAQLIREVSASAEPDASSLLSTELDETPADELAAEPPAEAEARDESDALETREPTEPAAVGAWRAPSLMLASLGVCLAVLAPTGLLRASALMQTSPSDECGGVGFLEC